MSKDRPASPGENWMRGDYIDPQKNRYPNKPGWVFIGKEAADQNDYDDLLAFVEGVDEPYNYDRLSIQGRWHPRWTYANAIILRIEPEDMMGGLGSNTYRMQKMHTGVKLTEERIWLNWYDEDGNQVMEKVVPPNKGAYHQDNNQMIWEGPMPGSQADKYIGDNKIFFDEKNGWYAV